ncbi:MAG: 50S ribosomal protein L6 [Candidatus Doudnabacteria bacterium RIFCSPLOWO2_02_FULL_49_13]|uniref:Large ribosomal subunit protein uL6 n=1 Tax=Candidatus Doudnabacteria bacterium RIFCSPHIGHO2_12_FULL_48_16 TaxID=1817838 RepID=A0A1F5PJ67_9BACT|nr:ribosomal protein L6 [uncultured bacterium]OGE87764.1 MAG: 50S ribosomal protein L6 [Candidatus Doudnabacteria bacterium RIFCSPHIGHO2_02_FULL_49_24]OGE88127.1 MAG: 50S ribosomal protein L6 [Candidatus Doudnabacteria bacterium RIFCSPHIGHO2_01_FULL_50_67]OGE89998.1 MAG: 50S ribosomal protein L6 [Candidatus Doudnabacteria bacterium RIFCSPHIGHO2_12_FULL_48_16]OGE96571.1 MAG: 50S ribosomal protein L6 [Candidatus Doudnabacteria bacterium RIFCSPLOWO2_01_FULL_49_40]OGF03142.1 MAG: 50S ribosomal pro
MSRIGKKPVTLPSGVTAEIQDQTLKVKGPKGELTLHVHPKVTVAQNGQDLVVSVKNEKVKSERALWGLSRALINNMVSGVTAGFSKTLEINGVGYKAAVTGKKLVMNLGYSHPIEMEIPDGLDVKVEKNVMTVAGIDRQLVGQFAAVVRSQREPEPYKGKGIKYSDEVIRRKAGKVVKAVGGGK